MICMSVLVELEFDNLRFGCKICSYIGFFVVVVLVVQTFFFSLNRVSWIFFFKFK